VRTFGMANIEDSKPVTPETPFAVASISKWLTATTILRLVEQGKLELDAPIVTYLPTYRADTGAKVTLRHLLCNASGVPNLLIPAFKADSTLINTPMTTTEVITRFCQGDLAFEPMAKFDYNLTNWILLLGIIETVTGQPYKEAMNTQTLAPLGLKATRADQAFVDDPATAISYSAINPPVRRTDVRPHYLVAAGGYYSTAGDLLKAAHSVFDRGFLKPSSLKQMLHVEVPGESYALGGRVKTLNVDNRPRNFAWETGRTTGFRSVLAHRLDTQETVIILNNTDMSQKTLDEFAYSLFGASLIPAAS
jgi:D-alanyl-D-alanine carboxypeptidase